MDKVGCGNPFNELAQFFNSKLKDLVDRLREELPEAAITYVDIYKARYTLINQASKYGKYRKLNTSSVYFYLLWLYVC